MMKKNLMLLCALFAGFAAYAQSTDPMLFTGLSLVGPIRAELVRAAAGETPRVVFESERDSRVKTTIEKGHMTLRAKKGKGSVADTVAVRVYYRQLETLEINGADVRFAETVTEPMFDLSVGGGVTFEADFDVRDLKTGVTGKSRVCLTGRARYFDLTVSTAEVKTRGLDAMCVTVNATHNAEVRVRATERLVADVTGSMVRYEGDPEIVRGEVSVFGGDLIPFDNLTPAE